MASTTKTSSAGRSASRAARSSGRSAPVRATAAAATPAHRAPSSAASSAAGKLPDGFSAYENSMPGAPLPPLPVPGTLCDLKDNRWQGPIAARVKEAGLACAVEMAGENALRLSFYRQAQPWPLADLMPVVDSCGLIALREETSFKTLDGLPLWVHDVVCAMPPVAPGPTETTALIAVMEACLHGVLEENSMNRLALLAALGPREITVWRAWVAMLQQIDRRFNPWLLRRVVRARPDMARALWDYFAALHQPGLDDKERVKRFDPPLLFLQTAIDALPTADQERVWSTLLGLVQATLRTNVWQCRDPENALAFKFDSSLIPGLPAPHPWREIFVYHHSVEGVHLRGGPVARGGLRHSDREADYRTEVLGLMMAQMRKNSIIVPVGAKGGFYVKTVNTGEPVIVPPSKSQVESCYRRYIRALLSVTDCYDDDGAVAHPRDVVCRDGDDPYLVVAADKGTARFSDTANDEAIRADFWDNVGHGFWLGDAFASGGSNGYDHKQMAITARGAWMSVEHHLGALHVSPSSAKPITMVGIGDMSGDVFGNGLLRSPHVQLIGAFNHLHVFLDPNPDPAISYAERARLFAAGLGWDGYDRSKISSGGGVFLRTAKSIPLSEAMQQRLGLRVAEATPDTVIRALLTAPVDVLWNGGIGTYIKASDEQHAAANDRANDDVRVDAAHVRARTIGEGGNLGITPKARVELALHGILLNTDALDNSAGVSASDHEVNVKILLQATMRDGLLDEDARNKLLRTMTDDMAALVLHDNHQQNLLVTLDAAEDAIYHGELHEWQQKLVTHGVIDPVVDCLPGLRDLMARHDLNGGRYTRPELCALAAGTKLWLRDELLKDPALLTSEAVRPLLVRYFPPAIQNRFGERIAEHPLAMQISATVLANMMVNRLGILGIPRLMSDFETSAASAARACTAAGSISRIPAMWSQLDAMTGDPAKPLAHDTIVAVSQRLKLVVSVMAAWLLRHGQPVDVSGWLKRLHGPSAEILALLPTVLKDRPEMTVWAAEWRDLGLPDTFAQRMAVLSPLVLAPDVVLAMENTKAPLAQALVTHLQVGSLLKLPALVRKVRAIAMPDAWARQAVQAMGQELFLRQRRITEKLLLQKCELEAWARENHHSLVRYHELVGSLTQEKTLTVAMLSVLIGRLRELES